MSIVGKLLGCLLLLSAPARAIGWQDLFNGRDLDGWDFQSKANWQVRGGVISVDKGADGLLTTRGIYRDFELEIEFRAAAGTESGICLCAPKEVADPGSECYEVNIAPDSSAYPTGSLTGRQRADGEESPDWRKVRVKVDGGKVEVWLDGKRIVEYEDRKPLRGGHIGLQFDQGRVEFRSIRIQKLDLP